MLFLGLITFFWVICVIQSEKVHLSKKHFPLQRSKTWNNFCLFFFSKTKKNGCEFEDLISSSHRHTHIHTHRYTLTHAHIPTNSQTHTHSLLQIHIHTQKYIKSCCFFSILLNKLNCFNLVFTTNNEYFDYIFSATIILPPKVIEKFQQLDLSVYFFSNANYSRNEWWF